MSPFHKWFDTLNIRNFEYSEFTNYFAVTRRGVTNSTPPEFLWSNIVPTLRIVDDLRDHFNSPVTLLSSYRSPSYNAAIDGAATRSYHKTFQALDISVRGKTPKQVFKLLSDWRDVGKFKGGLGLYKTFVHIDTRGTNTTW